VAHKQRPLRLTTHIFKTPEPNCVILAQCNAVLFRTHPLTRNSLKLHHKVAPPGESQQRDFALDNYICGNFTVRYWAEPVWTGCWIKSTAAVERREDRGRPRSGWTAVNFVLAVDLISNEKWRGLANVTHQWMVTLSRMRSAVERQTHQTYP